MDRRTFLKVLAASVPAIYSNNILVASASNVGIIAKNLGLQLSTAGRFSFYMDYSERSAVGAHTFYVCRTHGTQGRVTVDYATSGDSHTAVSGTLTWEDGEASIKSFTASVTSKTSGEHRICAELFNPTGGAVLHNDIFTKAYGVIDDNTIAADTDAIFYDAQASTNGNGTQANPYNNIYDAIANLQDERYLYGRGITVPDGTHSVNPNGGGGIADCIFIPAGRNNESTRLYITNWPGYTWTITGGSASNKIGFYSDGPGGIVGDSSFVTFKGIDFVDLNCSGGSYCEGGGIGYFKNECQSVNIEKCTFDNINGSTNTSGFNAYFVNGSKVWRCIANNIKVNGDNTDQNAGGLCLYYSATNLSFQRCEVTNAGVGFYFKRSRYGGILPKVSFCKIKCRVGIKYGFGSSGYETSYAIVSNNLFKNATNYYGLEFSGASTIGGKNWITNNVFDNCGGGNNGAIWSKDSYQHQIFNNIFLNCRKMWDIPESVNYQSDASKDQVEYADFNHDFNSDDRYEYLSIIYATSDALYNDTGFAGNDTTGDPMFTNPVNDDYSLRAGSPCLGNGLAGTDQGIFLLGIEQLGASVTGSTVKRSSAPTNLTVI